MRQGVLSEHRRSILSFCAWAMVTMTVVSLAYALAYLSMVPLRELPRWLLITVLYALALATGLILANGLLWAAVLVARRFGRAAASPGMLLQAIACCAGADIGFLLGESVKWGLLGQKPDFSPLLPTLVNQWWTGIGFLLLRVAVRYAARYRRIKEATKIAQGQLLASQLQPHFLFNSLHALSELMYTRDGGEALSELSLVSLEAQLDPDVFSRIHRKCIVRFGAIRAVGIGANPRVELVSGLSVPLARSKRRAVMERIRPPG